MEVEVVWRRQVATLLDKYVDGEKSILVKRLSDAWMVPTDTVYKLFRSIESNSRKTFVDFGLVDEILTAADYPEIFHLGEVRAIRKQFSNKEEIQERVLRKPEARKKCPGPLCKGKLRRVKEFYVYKRGRRAGRLEPYCKRCSAVRGRPYREAYKRRYRKHQEWTHYGNTPIKEIMADLEYLCCRFGPRKTAELIGVSYHSVWKWRKRLHAVVRKEYAIRVKQVAEEVRNGNAFKKI